MSQKIFQIFRSQISDLKADNVDYLKKPPWKKFFFDIFVIHLSSRYEKRCRILQRLFFLFQGSKNQLCIKSTEEYTWEWIKKSSFCKCWSNCLCTKRSLEKYIYGKKESLRNIQQKIAFEEYAAKKPTYLS